MILKFSSKTDSSEWTFADNITWITTNKNVLQEKDGNLTLEIRCEQGHEEIPTLFFTKEEAVYLLNDEGKTIECLN